MGLAQELMFVMKAKDEASNAINGVKKNVEGLGDTSNKVASIAKTAFLGIGAAIGVVIAASVPLIMAAAQEEAQISRLATAVDNAGGSWTKHGVTIEAALAGYEKITTFSDGEMRDALISLTNTTGSVDEAMKRLPIAMDIAAGSGLGLESASRLLGKVNDENTEGLKRLGVNLGEGATAVDVLREAQEKFVGQAKAQTDTVAGQWKMVKGQIGNITEDLGSALLPVASFVLKAIIGFIQNLRDGPLPGVIAKFGEVTAAVQRAFTTGPIAVFVKGVMAEVAKIPPFVATVVGSIGEIFDVLTGNRPSAGGELGKLIGTENAAGVMGSIASVREAFTSAFAVIQPIVQQAVDKIIELKAKYDELPPVIQAAFGVAAVGQVTGFNEQLVHIAGSTATASLGVVTLAKSLPGMADGLGQNIKLLPTAIGLLWLKVAAFGALVLAALPWILLAAAIALGIYLLIKHWDQLADTMRMIAAIVGQVFSTIGTKVREFFDYWGGIWKKITDDPVYFVGAMIGFLVTKFIQLAMEIARFAVQALATIINWTAAIQKSIGDFFSALPGNLRSWLTQAWTSISSFITTSWTNFDAWVTSIERLFDNLPTKMLEVGKSIVTGIWNGIQNMAGWLRDQAGSFARGIFDGIMRAISGGSPSLLFAKVGESISMGIVKGFIDNKPVLQIPDVIGGRVPAFSGGAVGGVSGGNGSSGGIYFAPGSIVVNGNLIGIDDLRSEIVGSVREAIHGGGFRGLIPSVNPNG